MPEKLLDRPDVVAVLQQVRGERVAEGMAGGALLDGGSPDGLPHGTLKHGFVQVVAAALARCALDVDPGSREHPLPGPFPACVRILA